MEKNEKIEGQFTEEELLTKIKNSEIEYVVVYVPSLWQNTYKTYEAKYFAKHILKDGLKLCEVLFIMNVEQIPIQTKSLGMDCGGNDCPIEIDRRTFRAMAWQGKEYAICIGSVKSVSNPKELHELVPRNILINTIEKFKQKFGAHFESASELEYYILDKTVPELTKTYPSINLNNHQTSQKHHHTSGIETSRYEVLNKKLKDNVKKSGITLEGLLNEYGPGQQEINYLYCETLKSCDDHNIIKQIVKHTTYANNFGCSFLAKTFSDQIGSASHVHLSAVDSNGKNFFQISKDEKENSVFEYKKDNKVTISNKLVYFIGGILKYVKELFLLYAPTLNSYKRFLKSSWAPYYINSWGYDNKFSTIRVLGNDESVHIEMRLAGSDANIYNVMIAILLSGMKGIEDKIMPPEIEGGFVYEKERSDFLTAPRNLDEAADLLEKSAFAVEALGENYISYLVGSAREETKQYDLHVSNYEINRYLDLI